MTFGFAKVFSATAECVWHVITDTHKWHKWGPSIRAVDTPQRTIRLGSKGRILTTAGIWLPFVITTFEPESYWDWRVGRLQATGHRLVSMGPNECRLSFTVPIWAFPYGIVCRIALNRIGLLLTQETQENS